MILLDSTHDFCENEAMVLDIWLDTSSGPKWPRCNFRVPDTKVKNFFCNFMSWLDLSHDFWANDGLFVKIAATVLDICLDTSSGPKWPRCGLRVPEPIYLMVLQKMMACFLKLQLRLWTYGLIHLLGTSGPNIVSRSQTPRAKFFLRFTDFIGFILWF